MHAGEATDGDGCSPKGQHGCRPAARDKEIFGHQRVGGGPAGISLLRRIAQAPRREAAPVSSLPRGAATVPENRRSVLTTASTEGRNQEPMRNTVNARSVVTSLSSAFWSMRPEEGILVRPITSGFAVERVLHRYVAFDEEFGAQVGRDRSGGGDAKLEVAAATRRNVGFGAATDDGDGFGEQLSPSMCVGCSGEADEAVALQHHGVSAATFRVPAAFVSRRRRCADGAEEE